MPRRRIVHAAAALLAAAALFPARAGAHAFLAHAEPRVGSTVNTPPTAVTLTFTEPIEANFSHVEVLDAQAKPVASGEIERVQPDQLRVTVPALAPGEYTVHWAVTSVDTHQTDGRFSFTVSGP